MERRGNKVRAAVLGATGYAGAELVRILLGHPDVELCALSSNQYVGAAFTSVYPALAGATGLVCEANDPAALAGRADAVFTALPHKLAMDSVPALLAGGAKVVDLSADFRFRNVAAYEAAYQKHSAPELSQKAVYGLPEIYGDAVRGADLVGNPGCYPTCTLLPLIPFVKAGLVDTGTIVADAKSGVSGAGRGLSLTVHYSEVTEGFSAYKVASHRHCPEMEEVLSREAGHDVRITFVPHLVPMSRGMLATSYARLTRELSAGEAHDILADFYNSAPFVRILAQGQFPQTRRVRGTNLIDIGAAVDAHAGRLVLVSAIDNLVKGAAGQAVQNMNLQFGLSETAGLSAVPFPV
jgi:N-acetyl-gamma-glutamyl-phosphate reductase